MDWSKTKTMFIFTFLLLNFFLGYQLLEKKNATEINLLSEATLQERLEEMGVVIEVTIPEDSGKGTHISGKREAFLKENVETLPKQQAQIIEDSTILSFLEEPYPLSKTDPDNQIEQFLQEYVLFGEEYRLGSWSEEGRQAGFFQMYDGVTVYNQEGVQLLLQVDENNQIISYQQRYLAIHRQGREQEMISGVKAIERLYNEMLIPANSHITQVELGYYSLFRPLGEVHVFAPMWSIRINQSHYLVNAIDGAIQNVK